jgi:tetratricopeptide (TPR) repeat protein
VLAESSTGDFTAYLAASLTDLSLRQSALGRQEALTTSEQAVELYRELAAAQPDAFTPDLASELLRQGARLSEAQQYEAALAIDREAVVLYLSLHHKSPERYAEEAQGALAHLIIDLRDLGYDDDAIERVVIDTLCQDQC